MPMRVSIAYVVGVENDTVVLNLFEGQRSPVVSYGGLSSSFANPGDLLGIPSGPDVIVLRVWAVGFTEPREAHQAGVGTDSLVTEPLRQLRARAIGCLRRDRSHLRFHPENWHLPALGSEAFPLNIDELHAIVFQGETDHSILLGSDAIISELEVTVPMNKLLPQHIAVLGGTGYGKTHFVASILQQIASRPKSRIVIFDVNGEYRDAFSHLPGNLVKTTVLGETLEPEIESLRIPYVALGRQGLVRLLLPSEKAQMPALRFAIEHLHYVHCDGNGAGLLGQPAVLFDDCRQTNAHEAWNALQIIRSNTATRVDVWPHFRAISCLAAEWYATGPRASAGRTEIRRDAFQYGHIASLVNRVRGFIEDEQFTSVVDVAGGGRVGGGWREEAKKLVSTIFGPSEQPQPPGSLWRVHIVDLTQLTADLMPYILGSLLELYASELFSRGPGRSHPTLLVLEEAHHYLRPLAGDFDSGPRALAYERLAKEGRKFSLSLLVSTQRPSELSPTVLAQCGTWCVFRLTNDNDQRAVASSSGLSQGGLVREMSSLPRGHALIFGSSLTMPLRVAVARPDPQPRSRDADFARAWQ